MATKKFSDYAIEGQNVTLTYDNINDTVTFDVVVDKNDVGLGNVDNTSDANKPVSTATQTALNLKQNSLVSGTNIKTVNSNTLLGSGDLVIDKTSVGLGNVANVDTTNATNITSGTLADARLTANVTTQGNTFNTANKLVQLDGTAKLPAIDGSQLTNLPTPATPTLATVTTAGNTTTNAINVGGLTVATNLIYTDTVNGRVGIGTVTPGYILHAKKDQNTSTELAIENITAGGLAASIFRFITSAGFTAIGMNSSTDSGLGSNRLYLYSGPGSSGLALRASQAAHNIKMYTGGDAVGNLRMSIESNGNVLINTTTDAGYKLDVNGTARVQATVGNSTYVASIINPTNSSAQFGLNVIAGNTDTARILTCGNGTQTILVVKGNRSININPAVPQGNYATLFVGNAFGGLPTLLVKGNGATSEITFQTQNSSGTALLTTLDNGNVLINTATDVTSSILTINSTTKGVLFPRMTTTQKNAISSPASGLVVYDTTLGKLCVYGAASWETITSI